MVGPSELNVVNVAVAEARIDLAVFQGQQDTVVEQLREILRLQELSLKALNLLIEMGARSPHDLSELEIAVIDTRIRILQSGADAE